MSRRNLKPNKSKINKQLQEHEEQEQQQFNADLEEEEEKEITEGKFFGCYLLTSLCPRFKGHTYIGFTVNPQRRIKQHNGEMRMGAFRTKRKRPWEMVLCIYGFPTNIAALQFEWAWQHPTESLAVRQVAATFKSLSGVGNKIKLAYAMLNLPSWQSLNMTVNFFSTKYKKHIASCPSLPRHMKVQVCSMNELSYYSSDNLDIYENDWDIEDDHVGGSDGESQNPESNMFPDLTSRIHCTVEANLSQRPNCLEGNLEQHLPSDDEEKDSNKSSGISSEVEGASSYSGSFDIAGSLDSNVLKPAQFHLELDQPSRKISTTRILSDEGNYSKKSSGISSEAEVTDLCNPSPCQKTNTLAQFHSELHQPSRVNFSATRISSDSNKSSGISSEAEVIDLFTPSPCQKTSTLSNVIKSSQFHPELHQPSRIDFSTTRLLSDDEGKDSTKSSAISSEVEVIDLFTPSPCNTSNSGATKRKRFSIWSHEIIDLTD